MSCLSKNVRGNSIFNSALDIYSVAYIGLGSNLANPISQINTAIQELSCLPQTTLLLASSLYQSSPMGPQDQPDFINAVVKLSTQLSPENLLLELQHLEQAHNRVRNEHWGPRTLDLDLLLYGDLVMQTPQLNLPHPGLMQRAFVVVPLLEIAPDLVLPNQIKLSEVLARLECADLKLMRI